MKGRPKVTLGLCVRNIENTISYTMNSILRQDFPHELIELIVVDGYSTDKTIRIIKHYLSNADIGSRFYFENEGLGFARQIVVDNATGEYIVWVDGDVILSQSYVRKQVEFMEKNPSVGIAKGKYELDLSREHESTVALLENVDFVLSTMTEREVRSGSLGTSGCIYRALTIRQAGGFDTSIGGAGEDSDAEYRIRRLGWSFRVTSSPFYEMRRETWKSLWNEYYWLGKGSRTLLKKDRQAISLREMFPPAVLGSELLRVGAAYRLIGHRVALLFPLHYVFKRCAWLFGFLRS